MTTNVTGFVHDLVSMAKAMEELPAVKAALATEVEHANRLAQTVQAREEAILRLKAEYEALQAKLKTAEAERDDAEIRFLEADDKAHRVLDMVRGVQALVGETVVTLDPPKPVEPEPAPVSVSVDPTTAPTPTSFDSPPADIAASTVGSISTEPGQSASPPTPAPVDPIGTGPESGSLSSEHVTPLPEPVAYVTNPTDGTKGDATGHSEVPKADTSPEAPGQSEAFPTPVEGLSQSSPSSTHSGQSPEVSSPLPEPKGPYHGKLYHDHPTYVTHDAWLAGGGTDANYFWRP